MGASLMERDLIGTAADILLKAKQSRCRIMLPEDGLAATAFSADVPSGKFKQGYFSHRNDVGHWSKGD
ncbi:MAG: hypothetical protein CM15mP80_04010 [Alphaproteobacteria bacterium]|nr:MAG: hypothetical protein CM15mP80_04010 [Alphaproteobacteria bacterium]